jgi:hypothetical protein
MQREPLLDWYLFFPKYSKSSASKGFLGEILIYLKEASLNISEQTV